MHYHYTKSPPWDQKITVFLPLAERQVFRRMWKTGSKWMEVTRCSTAFHTCTPKKKQTNIPHGGESERRMTNWLSLAAGPLNWVLSGNSAMFPTTCGGRVNCEWYACKHNTWCQVIAVFSAQTLLTAYQQWHLDCNISHTPQSTGALSDDAVWRLSYFCRSVAYTGISREQRGLGRLKLAQR